MSTAGSEQHCAPSGRSTSRCSVCQHASGPRAYGRYAAATIAILLLSTLPSLAQPPQVGARLTPDSIAIGDRFELEVTVDKDLMQVVDFPLFEQGMITEQVEIVSEGAVDTLAKEGRRVRFAKRYTLQTFEEGVHPLGRFPVLYVDKNIVDTLHSADSLVLRVGTFEIDTATMTVRELKPPMGAPLKAGELSGYALWALLLLAVAALIVWRVISLRRNLTMFGRPKPVDPPHVVAIKALEALDSQKLWQNNRHKQYYTRLTDILRTYMGGRWGVAAMEMTSDEIVAALAPHELPGREFGHLRDILHTADLVKFARQTPDAEANETAYTRAYYFVEGTKPTDVEQPEQPEL